MAIPGIPQNLSAQQGNAQVLLDWSLQSGALTYDVKRSTDGITYASVGTVAPNSYLDTTVTVGTNYFYKVASVNADGTSLYTSAVQVVPTRTGDDSLGSIRLQAQQRADRVGSNFVTKPEWNKYINQSAFELYDLLVTLYEDYYIADPYDVALDGSTDTVALPNLFYKDIGVDCAVDGINFQSLKKFNFIDRNKYAYPTQVAALSRGVNLSYRILGNNIKLTPYPTGGQTLRVWYVPRMTTLLLDTDILDGVSGWSEYVIVDAAIKALIKEESDVQGLMLQKQMLVKRIEESAANRDAGQPDTISNVRDMNRFNDPFGGYE